MMSSARAGLAKVCLPDIHHLILFVFRIFPQKVDRFRSLLMIEACLSVELVRNLAMSLALQRYSWMPTLHTLLCAIFFASNNIDFRETLLSYSTLLY
jgi:hypothetical protein